MKWIYLRPWIGTVARLVLGVLWIVAGWSKLWDPRDFVQAIRVYDATPEWLSKLMGYGLPVLELCIGVLLLLGAITRVAAIISAVLLAVFLIGIVQAAARGIKLDCACFGGGGGPTSNPHYTWDILRALGLLALAAFLIVWPLTRISVDEYLARGDYVAPPSAKRLRSDQGARRYYALVEARRKAARSRTLYVTSALAGLLVLIVMVGAGVQSGRAKIQGDKTALNASVVKGVVVGKPAKVTVDLFEDFHCPACNAFEQSAGGDIGAQIAQGRIQVRYHLLSLFDGSSKGNRYSSRAANAAICASDVSVELFARYHALLFGKNSSNVNTQPAQGSSGRTDIQLIDLAKQTGAVPASLKPFMTCVQIEEHQGFVQATQEAASKRGIGQVPTVLVNGKQLKTVDKASLDTAIAAVAGPAPSTTTTTSPSTSGTPSPTTSPSPSP